MLSATPGPWELEHSAQIVEQVVRPTGLLDPEVDIRPTTGQIDDLRERIDATVAAGYRVLVTTLTKKMAEDLTDYLARARGEGRVPPLRRGHHGPDRAAPGAPPGALSTSWWASTSSARASTFPEVALVAILDADKEGFLRSASSLIQTMGRAARNVHGRVVMYADSVTDSMTRAIGETQRRRARQIAYNLERGIDPVTITKSVSDILERVTGEGGSAALGASRGRRGSGPKPERAHGGVDPRAVAAELAGSVGADADELSALINRLDDEMQRAAEELRFEEAALLRDELAELRALLVRDPVDGSSVLAGETADIDGPIRRVTARAVTPAPVSSAPWLIDWRYAARARSTTSRTSPSTSPGTG